MTNKSVGAYCIRPVFALLAALFSLVLCQCANTISGYSFPAGTETAFAKKEPAKAELAELLVKAKAGNAEAQVEVGKIYRNGRKGIPVDYFQAYEWFNKAQQQGNAEAMYQIGNMHRCGEIGPLKTVTRWSYYYGGGQTSYTALEIDYPAALSWHKKAAEKNHSGAQKAIGDIYAMEYQNHYAVEPNAAEALKWYKQAADNGNGSAMVELFRIYQLGWETRVNAPWYADYLTIVEKNTNEAKKWFNKAVENGDLSTLIKLGYVLFEYGDEGQKKEATKLFSQAAEHELAFKQYFPILWDYKKGTNAEKLRLAVESENAQLEDKLALIVNLNGSSEIGNAQLQDILTLIVNLNADSETERLEWWRRAAENGNARTQADIAYKFLYHKDYAEAFKWAYKAATEGYSMAMPSKDKIHEGNIYGHNSAAENNWYIRALSLVGEMYREGKGVPKNEEEAVKWENMLKELDTGIKMRKKWNEHWEQIRSKEQETTK